MKMSSGHEIISLIQDYSRNISVKGLSKYVQWLGSKCHFAIFPTMSWKRHDYIFIVIYIILFWY